jgi:hypothetical protein
VRQTVFGCDEAGTLLSENLREPPPVPARKFGVFQKARLVPNASLIIKEHASEISFSTIKPLLR